MERERQENEQARLWNGTAGQAWVEEQALIDGILAPFQDLLLNAVRGAHPHQVLDVGCGTGSTTVAVAKVLGEGGRCTGLDVSEPMIAAARARAERQGAPASFVVADAQAHAFQPGSFDMIISRFGVMFFADPVRAFANLRRAARGGAELRFIAWRSPSENPFMTTAERAAAPLLPDLPPREPGAPGPFALADEDRVARILEESGWTSIDIQPVDVPCALPEKDLVRYITRFGPVGMALAEADGPTRARVLQTVRAAFDPFVHGDEVRYTAACWMVGARAD
ncbi:class I SAM-dependent methyltransferase [Longimicrobium sp.]|uniref:class I SAM-dependent methyltransferase n=1 Tax=Longimicrobium sp. TaxID=2029185 RepID=UPI002E313A66|nr:class I SAM-dependent methyltransferase [Longimicrobium sp.]HEX6040491.1 class I SAM-dependent methyltransferase [Longimicrobium sp.]